MNPVLVDNIKEHLMFCRLESVADVGCLFKANCFLCLRVLRFPSSIVRSTHLFTCCPPQWQVALQYGVAWGCPLVWGCSRRLPPTGGCSIITAAPTTHHPWLLNAQALLSQYQRGQLCCSALEPLQLCSAFPQVALSSALMDRAMQSDQGSAQTPATADHCTSIGSSTLSSSGGLKTPLTLTSNIPHYYPKYDYEIWAIEINSQS